VKLCRFELLAEPGRVRSGIVHGGKVYETDGANPIGVYDASQIRPLPPVGQSLSVRFFRAPEQEAAGGPNFFYGNPAALVGASQIVPYPVYTGDLDFEPYLGAVVAQDAFNVPVETADAYLIGLTIVNVLVARDIERQERQAGSGPGRSHDSAIVIGPVLTTLDDLEDAVVDDSRGRRYHLAAAARVNGVEVRRGDSENLAFTPAEVLSHASESCPLRPGDVLALGPLAVSETGTPSRLDPGDEIQIAVERLGTLSTKLGT
jgi:2-keto-4-pentenoate hydratase/2-oxohepta-3-ene-1,7-dioic acid hydratase in catechol pathway